MKKFKHGIKITLIFALLFTVVCVPILYIEVHNRSMLNKIEVSWIQTANRDDITETARNYNIWERLGMINNAVKVRTSGYTQLKSRAVTGREFETELINSMEEQLAMLCEYGLLPELLFYDMVQASYYKETYMDMSSYEGYVNENASQPKLTLSVWAIYAEYRDFNVWVYMDAEVSALYDITILSKNTDFVYQSKSTPEGFIEYLKSFSDIPEDIEEMFSAGGYCMEQEVRMYLFSVNKKTKQSTSYVFL